MRRRSIRALTLICLVLMLASAVLAPPSGDDANSDHTERKTTNLVPGQDADSGSLTAASELFEWLFGSEADDQVQGDWRQALSVLNERSNSSANNQPLYFGDLIARSGEWR